MAFVNISDPNKRKELVQRYLHTKNELKLKSENRKEGNLLKERAIEEQVRPIVTATEESANKIASVLQSSNISQKPSLRPYDFYSKITQNKDRYFSIYKTEFGLFKLGNSDIQIDEKNTIHVHGRQYMYTNGLWNLLMLNKPENYTPEDLTNYKELIKIVNLIDNPREIGLNGKPYGTVKSKFLRKILAEKRGRSLSDGDTEQTVKKSKGEGIILPGDINGLLQRLRLVCAERFAGNIQATTPEIVAILDELLRQKHITKPEYNAVCDRLQC